MITHHSRGPRVVGGRPKAVFGKRLFDILGATAGLVVLAPVMGVIAALVRMTSPGPVIYKGARVGLGGRDFEILKFRTMWHRSTDQLTTALNDSRVTPIGRTLRRYKLDELPQLVNVLLGDMSIVGPRPEFRKWVDLYEAHQLRILSVRPGITDLASIEFFQFDNIVGAEDADANYLDQVFSLKNSLRLRYVDELSWASDLRIMRGTILHMFRRN